MNKEEIVVSRCNGPKGDFMQIRITSERRVLKIHMSLEDWAFASTGRPSACEINEERW